VSKKTALSTDLFRNKPAPDFIKNHHLFRNPVKVEKVFPSIGLPNFREKANVDKCLIDIKKEGSYVHTLLRVMTEMIAQLKDSIAYKADKVQYLDNKDAREVGRAKLNDLYNLSNILTHLNQCVDPYSKDVLAGAIQSSEGKIALKLMRDIQDSNGKVVFRKDESLFKIFNKVKDKATSFDVAFNSLEQTEAFKIFSKENIPNKEFNIIFSSEGSEGAWDIATMSMRGIKSCQRWDGEYFRCLIGSILSKFVGIMYLTSGVQSDNQGAWTNLGTKMMRRSVIRYAIDADEGKPCILIDKMYPELDKDILALFINTIKSKTEIPVYYAQDLGNKLRHIYLPSEKVRREVLDREWSYQDTPLKTQEDLNIFYLNHNKEEIEREVKAFSINLALYLANKFEAVYQGNSSVDPEIQKTTKNIRMNTPFIQFTNNISSHVMNSFRAPSSKGFTSSRVYYRKYLMEFLLKRKQIAASCAPHLQQLLAQNTSRQVDIAAFNVYVFSVVAEFAKNELKKIIN